MGALAAAESASMAQPTDEYSELERHWLMRHHRIFQHRQKSTLELFEWVASIECLREKGRGVLNTDRKPLKGRRGIKPREIFSEIFVSGAVYVQMQIIAILKCNDEEKR